MQKDKIYELLNKTLFTWPQHASDKFTIGDSFEGVQIFGATGSGKTSGSGKHIAKSFLKNGYGGLVLCAKPSERNSWEAYIKKAGREKDMVIFSPGRGSFNPIAYEQKRFGKGAGETLNITNLIMSLNNLARNFMAGEGGENSSEKFWDNAVQRAISRMIDLLSLAGEDLTIMNMREVLVNALTRENAEQFFQINNIINDSKSGEADINIAVEKLQFLQKDNYCLRCLLKAIERDDLSKAQDNSRRLVQSYFFKEFALLSERTKSIVTEQFLGLIAPFETGLLQEQFSSDISDNLWPELAYEEGKIIILDFPVKEHLIAGVYAQGIYKFIFQQAMERRDTDKEENPRPCFLWVDESHLFTNPVYDALFQSTARSSLCATVLLTQGINSYYASMGSSRGEARAKSLLMNLTTKVFHASNDHDTNTYASDMIGQDFREMTSIQRKHTEIGQATLAEHLFPKIFPHELAMLEKGGDKSNGFKAEALIFKSPARGWSTKETYLKCKFAQRD